jgi:hypothetical protein
MLHWRVFFNVSRRFYDDEIHVHWDHVRVQAPSREPERGIIFTFQSIRVTLPDPAPLIQEMLCCL